MAGDAPVNSPLDPPEMKNKWPHAALQALLHYGGSALALYLLFHFLPGRQVWSALRTLPTRLWLGVLAGYLGAHCIGITKWRRMVNLAGAGLNVPQAARCYFAGLFGSLFLPSLIGGDLVRAGLALRLGRSKAGVLLGSFLDRIVDLAALAILALTGALLVPGALDERSRRIFILIGAAAILGAAAVAAAIALLPVGKFSYRMRRRIVRLRRAGRSMAARPKAVLGNLGLALAAQLIFIYLSILLAEACGLHLPFRTWVFAWPLAKLSAALPVTQGGIGVREAALAALLLPFGAPAVLTVAAGLAWEAIVVSGGMISGATSLLLGRTFARVS
ncbi:MAG TPA: lysylphosphatidylglycerol synthase transmembrane domain-containing protein [Candidatus Limnocylindrales bacterium]|nr:lysylphosphatidylglycerol synthase transmembrane domain-containing protein [Candidatus Limnocylindrales bacterium]